MQKNGIKLAKELTRTGHSFNVVALNDEFILLGGRVSTSYTLGHGHTTKKLLAQKVTNLHNSVLFAGGNVNGKMGIDRTHFVQVTLGDTDNHVLNMRADCADSGKLLADTKPFLHAELLLADKFNIQLLLELTTENTTGTLNTNLSVVHGHFDCIQKPKVELESI